MYTRPPIAQCPPSQTAPQIRQTQTVPEPAGCTASCCRGRAASRRFHAGTLCRRPTTTAVCLPRPPSCEKASPPPACTCVGTRISPAHSWPVCPICL